jgi:uncharacterized membrane protein
MQIKIINSLYSLNNLIKYLSIFVVIIGICFRFANWQEQVINWDEVRGFYRIAGYVKQEVMDKMLIGEIVNLQDIQSFQNLSPEKTLTDTLYALVNNPEHPPLFYLMGRFSMQLFPSPYSVRMLSILLGIIVLPFLYWLCLELFESKLLAWITIALFSISPYQILLAQAARQYTLWILFTIISSIFLLKALKNGKKVNWIIYCISSTLGLYSHLFFAFTCVSQGIYVLFKERFSLNRNLLSYLISSLVTILSFIPWIFVLFINSRQFNAVTDWATKEKSSFKEIILDNINNIGNIFIDVANTRRFEGYLSVIIVLLVIYSLYFICRKTSTNTWLFVLLLIFPSWLALIIPDLFSSQGIRSLQLRYLVPSYLGIQICIGFLIARSIEAYKSFIRWGAIFIFICLIFLGLISGNYLAFSPDWDYLHLKGTPMSRNVTIAPIINQSLNPLVISQASHHFILCLSYVMDSHVKFQLFTKYNLNQWENKLKLKEDSRKFSDIFIYYPDQSFLDFLSKKFSDFRQEEVAKGLFYFLKNSLSVDTVDTDTIA